jgi:hypothetical protein
MKSVMNNLHGFSNGYLIIILLLAISTCTYGLINLSSAAFRAPNHRSDIEQSDQLVIGFFNVFISIVSICTVILIAG